MSYTIAIAIPSIAPADVEAWQQVDELIDRLHAGSARACWPLPGGLLVVDTEAPAARQ